MDSIDLAIALTLKLAPLFVSAGAGSWLAIQVVDYLKPWRL